MLFGKRAIRLVVLLVCIGTSATAKPPLREVEAVREGLIAAGIAWEIGERCDAISARLLRGIFFLQSIEKTAKDLGYSEQEIDAYTSDRAEQDALEEVARARLIAMGAVPGDAASHCAVGRSEIAAETPIGRLLRN